MQAALSRLHIALTGRLGSGPALGPGCKRRGSREGAPFPFRAVYFLLQRRSSHSTGNASAIAW
jgi:hypothetical protein